MMQVPDRPKPQSVKSLKFVPETYNCHLCKNQAIYIPKYLEHLENFHDLKLNRDICVHGPIYNDVLAWKRTGDNVSQNNMLFIVDDGRFPGFKQIGGSDNSTDGSKELILSYGNTMYFPHGEDYEEAKFNFAMHLTAKMGFKYVILLGSDEWIVGDIKKLVKKLDRRMKKLPKFESQAFQVAVDEHQPQNKWNKFITESPKIYYGPGLLRTRFTHWLRYSATQIAKRGQDIPIQHFQKRICDVVIHHDDSIRGHDRNRLMTKFQDGNVEREQLRIMREAFQAHNKVSFFISNRKLSDWHKSFFLKGKYPYSHYIIYDDEVKITSKILNQIHRCLYYHPEIDVLSIVYKIDSKKNWKVTDVPPKAKFFTEKIYDIYHNCKFSRKMIFHTLTLETGPIIAVSRNVVESVSSLSDKKQFMSECLMNSFKVVADSSIQIRKKK